MFKILLLVLSASSILAFPFDNFYGQINPVRWPTSRIVGGNATSIEDYPYQASLQFGGRHICGSNIISEKYSLTAAHCTDGSVATFLSLRAGSSFHESGGIVVSISKIIQHPLYNGWIIDYDYSILQHSQSLSFSPTIQPIQIICLNQDFKDGTEVKTSGWGSTQSPSESNDKLRVVYVEIINQKICQQAYSGINAAVTDRMICAGFYESGGKDACQGDSGGPLAVKLDKPVLVGLVSWGLGCARPRFPGVYSRVSVVSDWIKETTGIKDCYSINSNDFGNFINPLMRN